MPQSLISNEEKQQKLNEELLQATRNKKDLSIIEEIITRGANVNYADKNGETPLHWACYNGHTEVAIALIGKGANVNYADKNGWTPLHR